MSITQKAEYINILNLAGKVCNSEWGQGLQLPEVNVSLESELPALSVIFIIFLFKT